MKALTARYATGPGAVPDGTRRIARGLFSALILALAIHVVPAADTAAAANGNCTWYADVYEVSAQPRTIEAGEQTIITAHWIINNPMLQFGGCSLKPAAPHCPDGISWCATPSATTTYTADCLFVENPPNTFWCDASNTVKVTVSPPKLNLSVSSGTIGVGQSTRVSWSTTDATSCVASGDWSGPKSVPNGSEVVSPVKNSTYVLTCSNATNDTIQNSIAVTVVPPPGASIYADPGIIGAGQASTLTWSSTNATSCGASADWGGPLALTGSLNVTPDHTSTYVLTCANAVGQTVRQTATVTVVPPPPLTFSADPTTIGVGQSSNLSWSSTGAVGCSASGAWSGAKELSGVQAVGPATTSNYVLTCWNSLDQQVTRSASVNVIPAPTVSFSASPSQIPSGTSSTLTWASSNATGCTASNAWSGPRPPSGTATVMPSTTATYSLSCTGAGGAGAASTTVTVVPPVPTVTLTAMPPAIVEGQSSSLNWTSSYASSCTASGGWTGGKGTSGGPLVVKPAQNTTYVLTCTGNGGTASSSLEITVDPGDADNWVPPVSLAPAIDTGGTAQDIVALDDQSIALVVSSVAYTSLHAGSGAFSAPFWQLPQAMGTPPNGQSISGITFDGSMSTMLVALPNSSPGNSQNLWFSSTTGAGWAPLTEQPGANSGLDETDPALGSDGTTLLFSSNRGGFGGWDLYVQQRVLGQWANASNLGQPVNSASDERFPYLTPDGKRLYFARRESGGTWQIYRANWTGESWGDPLPLPAPVNSPSSNQIQPALSPNGSKLYFLSDQGSSANQYEIYLTVRRTTDTDGDGILDYDVSQPNKIGDNCWNMVNPDQADVNNNGIGDLCDVEVGCSSVNRDRSPANFVAGAGVLGLALWSRRRGRRLRFSPFRASPSTESSETSPARSTGLDLVDVAGAVVASRSILTASGPGRGNPTPKPFPIPKPHGGGRHAERTPNS